MHEGAPSQETFDPKKEVTLIEALIDDTAEKMEEFAATTAIEARNIASAISKSTTREGMIDDLKFRLKAPKNDDARAAIEFILREHFGVEVEG